NLQHVEGITAEELRQEHRAKGMPESLVEVLHLAALADVRRLVFDADAPVLDGLTLYDDEYPATHSSPHVGALLFRGTRCRRIAASRRTAAAMCRTLAACSLALPAACPGSRDLRDCGAVRHAGCFFRRTHAASIHLTLKGHISLAG